jgi:hypothetical protein
LGSPPRARSAAPAIVGGWGASMGWSGAWRGHLRRALARKRSGISFVPRAYGRGVMPSNYGRFVRVFRPRDRVAVCSFMRDLLVHCSFFLGTAPIGVIALNQAYYERSVAMRLDGGIRMDLSSGLMNLVVSRTTIGWRPVTTSTIVAAQRSPVDTFRTSRDVRLESGSPPTTLDLWVHALV